MPIKLLFALAHPYLRPFFYCAKFVQLFEYSPRNILIPGLYKTFCAWPGPFYFVSGRKYFPPRIVTGEVKLTKKKTPKTADGEIDWDLASDVTSYIQHNT